MSEEIKFYRTGDPYGCFSNFSAHPILIETMWPTSEHYFQAQKFLDAEPISKILHEKSPMKAAKMGRSREWPIRTDWDEVKDDMMRIAVSAKVRQHSDVRELLLSTGDATIIEHTSNDSYWADGGDGTGKNMLGKILMEIRDQLTKNGPFDELADPLTPPWLKHPELDRYSMGWRMGYGEDYLVDWIVWYKGLSKDGQTKYRADNVPPDEWSDCYESMSK